MISTSAIVLAACILVAAAVLAAVSRHKKSGTSEVKLIGAKGYVETTLAPHGTVLIQGELWRACSNDANAIETGSKVSVVGIRDHLLLVSLRDQ
jgi:membrane-bound ClpP family serine protease